MPTRLSKTFGPLAVAAVVLAGAACGKQDAGAFIAPNEAEFIAQTGVIRAVVMRDTATSRTVPRFAPASGVRVNLFAAGDLSTPVRQLTTSSTGEVTFVGLPPGSYTLITSVNPKSRVVANVAGDTAATYTITAGDTLLTDTVRVRQSARVSGLVASRFIDQEREKTIRYPGIKVVLHRETGSGTNVFVPADSTVTDATGSYEFRVTPGPERAQVRFNSADITALTDPELLFLGAGVPPYVKKPELVTVTGLTPDANRFGDLLFQYSSKITISPFRDQNENGIRDIGEGMLRGDTVVFQLRDASGKVIAQPTLLRAIATSDGARPVTSTLNSVKAGTYTITVDRIASRFPQTPFTYTSDASFPPQTVTVIASSGNPAVTYSVLFPIPGCFQFPEPASCS